MEEDFQILDQLGVKLEFYQEHMVPLYLLEVKLKQLKPQPLVLLMMNKELKV